MENVIKSGSEICINQTLKNIRHLTLKNKTFSELRRSATMAASNRDWERLKRMAKASNPYRKTMICQLLVASVLIYFWYSFNEGQ
jgi:hypothetical protein